MRSNLPVKAGIITSSDKSVITVVAVQFLLPALLLICWSKQAAAQNIDSLRSSGFNERYIHFGNSVTLQKKALQSARSGKKQDQVVISYCFLAATYSINNNITEVAAYADSAFYLSIRLRTPLALGYGNFAKGLMYRELEQTKEAIPYLYKAYSYFSQIGDDLMLSSVATVISQSFAETNLIRAQEMAVRALDHAAASGKIELKVNARVQYAYVYYMSRIDDPDSASLLPEALSYYKEIIGQIERHAGSLGNKGTVIAPYICISILYSRLPQQQYRDSFLHYIDEAKTLVEAYPSTGLYGNIVGIKGEYYLMDGRYDAAKRLFEKGISYLKQYDATNNKVIAALYSSLSKMAISDGDYVSYYTYDTAYKYYEKLKNKDVLTQDLEIAYSRFESDRKSTIITALKKENQLQSRNRILLIAASILLGIGLVLFYAFYRFRNKYNRQLSLQLKEKGRIAVLELQLQKQEMVNLIHEKMILEGKFLQSQMDPHFTFNVMGSLQHFLLSNDADSALIYMDTFAALLRKILVNIRKDKVTVAEELEVLRSYIELQQLRFSHSFAYTIDMDNHVPLTAQIPPMLLQPFVENAIEHGLKPLKETEPGQLAIHVYRSEAQDQLIWTITDNGIGITKSKEINNRMGKVHESIAMKITEERIARIPGAGKVIVEDIINADGSSGGTKVTVIIPVT